MGNDFVGAVGGSAGVVGAGVGQLLDHIQAVLPDLRIGKGLLISGVIGLVAGEHAGHDHGDGGVSAAKSDRDFIRGNLADLADQSDQLLPRGGRSQAVLLEQVLVINNAAELEAEEGGIHLTVHGNTVLHGAADYAFAVIRVRQIH